MDIPGMFYRTSGSSSGGEGVVGGSMPIVTPSVSSSSFFSDIDQDIYPQGNEQGPSGDTIAAFDNWFANHAMDYQSSDSPEAVQHVQQGQGAASAASSGVSMMMDQQQTQIRTMQGRPELQQQSMGVQQQPVHLQHPQQMFGPLGHMQPFMNYDPMGLMPVGAHHLPPPQAMQPPQLPPHSATAAAAAALFPGPQLFTTCSAHLGSSLSIPSTSFIPFDGIQLSLAHHHHPSTSMAQQQQLQHMQQVQQQAAAEVVLHNVYSASASDSSSQITTVLMGFRQGGEESEFVRKAIESLVKKLKDKRLELEALISAVTSSGKTPTGCVTIQRSLDGRLQVAGRKGVPHVVYARIWRWPNVSKTELAKLSICRVTPDNQDFICINPYHYERVVSSAGGMMSQPEQQQQQLQPVQPKLQQPPTAAAATPISYPFDGTGVEWAAAMPPSAAAAIQAEMRLPLQQQHLQQPAAGSPEFRSPPFPTEPPVMHRSHAIDLNRVQIPAAAHYPTHWCTINYFEHDTQVGESFKVRREMISITVDGGLDPQGERNGRFCVGSIPNVHRQSAVEIVRMHIGAGVVVKQHQDGRVTMQVRSNKAIFVRAPYMDYVKHTPYATTVHKVQQCDGEITIFDLKWAYFEMCEQTASAKEAVLAQARAVAGLPVNHPGMQQMSEMVAGSGVDEMKRMFCSVGMSFVKGFGGIYNRKSIKDCPCWIEVELHRPLQLLDQLLKRSYND